MRREAWRDARCWPRYICGDPHFLSFLLGKKNNLHSNFCEIVSLTVDILLPRPVLSDSCFFVTLVSILFPVERHYDQPILSISCIIQCTVQRVTGRIKSAQTTAWNKCCTVPKPLWSGSSVCPLLFSASFIVLYLFIFCCVCAKATPHIFWRKLKTGAIVSSKIYLFSCFVTKKKNSAICW